MSARTIIEDYGNRFVPGETTVTFAGRRFKIPNEELTHREIWSRLIREFGLRGDAAGQFAHKHGSEKIRLDAGKGDVNEFTLSELLSFIQPR